MNQAGREVARVGRGVRVFVWTFLALFVGFGVSGVDVWPFSGFHLFSHVRTDRFTAWEITTVDGSGDERPVAADRRTIHLVSRLSKLSEDERRAACQSWGVAVAGAVEVRVYATVDSVRDPGRGQRELRYSCHT